MFMDSNPYLVAVTMIVSLLHSVFEILAVKNGANNFLIFALTSCLDIAFWKNLNSHKGISLRTLYVSFVFEVIVLLYLFDNETSTLILISSVVELALTIWKIFKTTKFKVSSFSMKNSVKPLIAKRGRQIPILLIGL